MPKGIPKNGVNKGWFKKGFTPWHKGLKIDRNIYPNYGHLMKQTKEAKEKIRLSKLGHKVSLETRIKMGKSHRGERNGLWKGGISKLKRPRASFMETPEYQKWRTDCFKRDKYTCILCGAKSGLGKTIKLCVDHIKPYSKYPELRIDITNGRTLCYPCHRKTDTWGRPSKKYAKN